MWQPRFFFNSPLFLNSRKDFLYTTLQHPVDGPARACIVLYRQGNQGFSPINAGFGGIELSPDAAPVDVQALLSEADHWAKAEKLLSITVTDYPGFMENSITALRNGFSDAGYQTVYTDLNYHLPLEITDFKRGLSPANRRKLRLLQAAGFTFNVLEDPDLMSVFDFISGSRMRRGFTLGQDETAFKAMFSDLPGVYTVFEVAGPSGERAAAGVGLCTAPDVYYLFYTADTPEFRTLSPVVLLHQGVYSFARTLGCRFLDLGTASNKGVLNEGVARFKRGLGALPSEKCTLFKQIRY